LRRTIGLGRAVGKNLALVTRRDLVITETSLPCARDGSAPETVTLITANPANPGGD
jgi:hypothetical protein